MTSTNDRPLQIDILVKKNDRDSYYVIENCTAKAFADNEESIRYYAIGDEISLRNDIGEIKKWIIKDIKFHPSPSNGVVVLSIFV